MIVCDVAALCYPRKGESVVNTVNSSELAQWTNGAKIATGHTPLTRSASQWKAFLKNCCQLTSLQVLVLAVSHSYPLRLDL